MTTQLQYIEKDTCDDALLSLSALQKIDAWGACEHETRIRRKQCLESSSIAASRRTFRQLVKKWRDETWFISSIKKRIAHPDYLKIIGMGSVAIPWILEELRGEPDY